MFIVLILTFLCFNFQLTLKLGDGFGHSKGAVIGGDGRDGIDYCGMGTMLKIVVGWDGNGMTG